MIQLLGENYFIDLDEIERYVDTESSPSTETSGTTQQQVNLIKYELVKLMLDVIFSENDFGDEKLGLKGQNNTSVPFKLAFNTLLNKKLINRY